MISTDKYHSIFWMHFPVSGMNPQLIFQTWEAQPTWDKVKDKLSSLRKDASKNNAYVYHVHTGKDDFAPSPPLEIESDDIEM